MHEQRKTLKNRTKKKTQKRVALDSNQEQKFESQEFTCNHMTD